MMMTAVVSKSRLEERGWSKMEGEVSGVGKASSTPTAATQPEDHVRGNVFWVYKGYLPSPIPGLLTSPMARQNHPFAFT